jgi:pimeloyl-ACP methyl ester carboxylesterase
MSAALVTGALLLTAAPARADTVRASVSWEACPRYSDEVLRMVGGPEADLAGLRRLFDRLECGKIGVPQDYGDPGGTQITIAITRLKAADQAHRLGSLALNPGGPGGSGYLMPIELTTHGVTLNDRYDLIGFDPRGVGYSTETDCPPGGGERPAPGPITEEIARQVYADIVAGNQACGNSDPAFIGQLTTANVARDLDRIRAGLNESKISYFGVSWGTWLGAVYRTLFPGKVRRMWLDSMAIPVPKMNVFVEVRAKATEATSRREAAWIAERNDFYGLGATKDEVVAKLTEMTKAFNTHPLTFTDIDLTVDGPLFAQIAGQPSVAWPEVAQVIKELVDAKGPEAPPTIKRIFSRQGSPPPADAPEDRNRTANTAFFCNEDLGPRTFESAWNAYQRRLERYPVTGVSSEFFPACAGWPLPVQATRLQYGGGSLVLSGHLHEIPSPYEWTTQTHALIGGNVVTIDDDIHGSALGVPECEPKIVTYFTTGRAPATCPGVPVPTSTDLPGDDAQARTLSGITGGGLTGG